MSISQIDRADAAYREEVVAAWRAWRTYLRAQRALLEARATTGQAAFERDAAGEAQAAQAEADLSRLTSARRALFDAVYEQQRQAVQAHMEDELRTPASPTGHGGMRPQILNPDEVDRRTLDELLGEAEGRTTDDGWGRVPVGTAEQIEILALNVEQLLAAPDAASYAAGMAGDDARRRLMGIAGLLAGLVLFLVFWFGGGGSALPASALPGSTANDVALEPWPLRALVLAGDGTETTVPLSVTQALSWPSADPAATPTGYWRAAPLVPLTVCAPDTLLASARTARLIGGGTTPDRVYALQATRSSHVDLVVAPCRADAEAEALVRYGTLQATIALPQHAVGETVTLGDGQQVTLRAVAVVGPGQDLTLPEGQERIVVRVAAALPLDWPAYAPTLLLANGQAILPGETVPAEDGAELRYLAPLAQAPLEAAWTISPPDGKRAARWRLTLAPPPSRQETLRQVLAVTQVEARMGEAGLLTLRIALANRGDTPLQLRSADLAFTQASAPLPAPEVPMLRDPLAPGETRTLELAVPISHPQQPITFTIGAERFRIQP